MEGIFLDVREVKVPEGSGPPGETETKLYSRKSWGRMRREGSRCVTDSWPDSCGHAAKSLWGLLCVVRCSHLAGGLLQLKLLFGQPLL